MLLLLFSCSLSILQEYNENHENLLDPKTYSTLVYFYNSESSHEGLEIMKRIASVALDIELLTINCSKYDICQKKFFEPIPGFRLFRPHSKHPLDFTNEHSFYAVAMFLLKNSKAKVTLPPSHLQRFSYNNYSTFLGTNNCKVVTFIQSRDRMSELLYPTIEELSFIFSKETDMSFGLVNCSFNVTFCFQLGIQEAPIIRIYKGNNVFDYVGTRELPFLLNFVNEKCSKQRTKTGALQQISFELSELIKEFMNNSNKKEVLEKTKNFANSEFVISVMKSVIEKGESEIKRGISILKKIIEQAKGKKLEDVEEKLRVLQEFEKYIPESEL